MFKLKSLLVLSAFAAIGSANAGFVCTGQASFGSQLQLTLRDDGTAQIKVTGADGTVERDESLPKTDWVWDGHLTGLVTAPGLSVKYQNHFGVIRFAEITTALTPRGLIGTVEVPTCQKL